MSEISRVALFGKLNSLAYKAIEAATVFCKLRGNPYVELVHWFHQILQLPDSDLHQIVRQSGIDPARLAKDLTEALDRLPRGSTSITDLSSHVEEAVERGWVYGSLMFGESQVRTGYLVIGILKTPSLRHALTGLSAEFAKLKVEALTERFDEYVGASPENGLSASDGFNAGAAPGEASGALAPSAMGKQEALKRFTVDLTEQARSGKLDPIVGRDEEIRQLVDILMRRRQNNPILTGEAGVGKTAVVEGFALRIVAGDVPPALKDVELRALDVGLLQAGASMKGEFEQRLRQVIEDVQSSEKPIILFIDEAHTLVGAGGAAGTGDAANLLAGPGARHPAHRGGDHLGRVQEAHREGPGADPAFPGGAGGRAVRAQGHPDDARRRVDHGEAPPGADPRRGAGGGGPAVAPLHPGAPAAGQVGEPAGYRLRAHRHQPARGAGRGRR